MIAAQTSPDTDSRIGTGWDVPSLLAISVTASVRLYLSANRPYELTGAKHEMQNRDVGSISEA